MTRRLMMAALLAVIVTGTAPVAAHDDYRVIGTITKVTAKTLDVKQTKDDTIISMTVNGATVVTRDKKKVDTGELKIGLSVVVDARGDSLKDLVVIEVKLVPSPAKS